MKTSFECDRPALGMMCNVGSGVRRHLKQTHKSMTLSSQAPVPSHNAVQSILLVYCAAIPWGVGERMLSLMDGQNFTFLLTSGNFVLVSPHVASLTQRTPFVSVCCQEWISSAVVQCVFFECRYLYFTVRNLFKSFDARFTKRFHWVLCSVPETNCFGRRLTFAA